MTSVAVTPGLNSYVAGNSQPSRLDAVTPYADGSATAACRSASGMPMPSARIGSDCATVRPSRS